MYLLFWLKILSVWKIVRQNFIESQINGFFWNQLIINDIRWINKQLYTNKKLTWNMNPSCQHDGFTNQFLQDWYSTVWAQFVHHCNEYICGSKYILVLSPATGWPLSCYVDMCPLQKLGFVEGPLRGLCLVIAEFLSAFFRLEVLYVESLQWSWTNGEKN